MNISDFSSERLPGVVLFVLFHSYIFKTFCSNNAVVSYIFEAFSKRTLCQHRKIIALFYF